MYICSKCDKPFNTESSHDRHLRYCGTRVRQRQRSCQACATAKTKCSFGTPCSRCLRKQVECVYSNRASSRAQASFQKSPSEDVDLQQLDDHLHNFLTPTRQALSQAIVSTVLDSIKDSADELEQNLPSEPQSMQASNPVAVHASSHDIFSSHNSIGSAREYVWKPPAWCSWAQPGLSLALISSNSTTAVTPVLSTQSEHDVAHHYADFIIQSLRAFPTMMTRRETWPWFIHAHSHLLSKSATALPESLSACMGVAQVYVLGTTESKPFVWQTISTGCRRIAQTMHTMSRYELLAAAQACMIYLVICIIDRSSQNDQIGSELLQVMGDVYAFNKKAYGSRSCEPEISVPSSDWTEWIFAESQRRLANLWFLIGCVVGIKSNNFHDQSQSHRDIPLPGPKSLWEASSESAWKVEYEASRSLQMSGLVCLGDLIDVQKSSHRQASAQKLDLWNASVDNLGLLLNSVHHVT